MATAVASADVYPGHRWPKLPDHLPDLSGKWLTLFTIVWAITLCLAIVGPVRSAYLLTGYFARPVWLPHGFGILSVSDGLRISAVTSADARGAGARAGDRIVAIDGWIVPHSPAAETQARAHIVKREGHATVFTFAAPGKTPRDVRLTYSRRHLEQTFTNAGLTSATDAALIICNDVLICVSLVISAVLLFIRQRQKAVPAFLSLGFLLTVATAWGTDWSDLGVRYIVSGTVNMLGWVLIFAALLAFPTGTLSPRWTRWGVVLLPILCFLPAITLSDFILLPTLGGLFVATVIALVGRYRQLSAGAERQQLRWVFFGFIAGSVMLLFDIIWLLVTEQLQAVDARWYVWSVFGGVFAALGVSFIALGLSVSILRYRLYDADAVIGRSAAYGVLTIGFVGLFAGSEKLTELIGERYFENSIGIAAGAVGAAVAAVCIVPLHNRVHRWAERRFQKPLIRLREGLPECVADLRESAPIRQLVTAVMARIAAGVHSTREAILLADNGKLMIAGVRNVRVDDVRVWQARFTAPAGDHNLDCDRHDSLFPLRVRLCIESGEQPEMIGWLLLGARPDGTFFGKDEREALQSVAGPIARAFHIAQLREQIEEEQREQQRRSDARLSALERIVMRLLSNIGPLKGDGMPQSIA